MPWFLDYLCGMCVPHPANDVRRHHLYKKKATLMNLNLWMDKEYRQRQEEKTVRDHKRDIIPNCIISYIPLFFFWLGVLLLAMYSIFHAGNSWTLSKY